jgi:PadR family transcriptional regulator, regulatory protein PadR
MGGRIELPQGTLDVLILKAVALEPQHGWAIGDRIKQMSKDVLNVQQGSLYPALHRLERKGWLKARWAVTANKRRAKYYELSKKGRAQLEAQVDTWRALSVALSDLLDLA